MNIFLSFLIVSFISLIGFTFIKAFNFLPNVSRLKAIGYSYGLGVGLIAFQLYFYSRLGIPWDKALIMLPWLIFILLAIIYKKPKLNLRFKLRNLKRIEIFIIALILATVSYVLLEALIRPLAVWDGWAIWLLKAKIFFIDGKILPSVLDYVQSDYPLVISLLGSFVYIFLGQVDDTAVLLAFFAFYLFLGILFFSVVKEKFGMTYALFVTFLFLTLQNLIRHGGRMEVGQADLALGYYIFICVTLLFEVIKKINYKNLILLNIFLGIMGLIKFEGLAFSFVAQAILIYFLFRKNQFNSIFWGLFWILPIIEWELFKITFGLSVSYFSAHTLILSLEKIKLSIEGIIKELINIKSWNVFWITYFFTVLTIRLKTKEILLLNFFILTQLTIYTILYFFTVGNSPESSIERLLVHVAPLAMLSIVITLKKKKIFNSK